MIAGLTGYYGAKLPRIDGLLYDLATAARAVYLTPPPVKAPPVTGDGPHVVVIALDRRSLAAPELQGYPRALFGPVWAQLVETLAAAEAKVIAFDFVLAYGARDFHVDFPEIRRGFDRGFLQALKEWGDRIVLGREGELRPTKIYERILQFSGGEMGMLSLNPDEDGIFRNINTATVTVDGEQIPTLPTVALAKAGITEIPAQVRLAPRRHLEYLPTLSLIDVLNCGATAPAMLTAALKNAIVFIGTTLPEEDRKATPSRYLSPPPGNDNPPETASGADACTPLQHPGASAPDRPDVAGVYIHAGVADTIISGPLVRPLHPLLFAFVVMAVAAVVATVNFRWSPFWGVGILLLLLIGVFVVEVLLLDADIYFPSGLSMAAGIFALAVGYPVRFFNEERKRQNIQKAFGHYLAPALVDRMLEDPSGLLTRGGSASEVTVMFADLSGFTKLSTLVSAEELVRLTNAYLDFIAIDIDKTHGYVDKFIGDAVMALWGAPVPEPDHAFEAVNCALMVAEEVDRRRRRAVETGEHAYGIKIGLYSGPAVVGNVGAEDRLNYTAVGETVNIASRLEGLPGDYGCTILIGETTAGLVRQRVRLREIDFVAVKGRDKPVTLFMPLGLVGGTPDREERILNKEYAEALALYRDGAFAEAATIWTALADAGDGPSSRMATQAWQLHENPPEDEWDGVWRRTTK